MSESASIQMTIPNLTAMEALARRTAERVRPGDAILLEGPLGAGKTAFARAFLRALTGTPDLEVPSPTFTLVQSYDTARGPVHHFDLWRLSGPEALVELGWDDALADIVMVEWPERLGDERPGDALSIIIALGQNSGDDDARVVTLSGWAGRVP